MKTGSKTVSNVRGPQFRLRFAAAAATWMWLNFSFAAAQSPAPPPVPESVGTSPDRPPAAAALPALLLARRNVGNYFAEAANMVCTESVTQAMLGKNDKPFYHEDSAYDYQLRASTDNGTLKLVESRETRKPPFHDAARTLLITNGFTSMLLIAHSDYEDSYTFESDGEETADGVTLSRIRFKPIPGASSPAAMQLRGQSYPIPLSGTLWIDSKTGAVTKLIASVDSSMSDLGLQGMRSEIHYGLMQFHDPEEAYWMPISATIDVQTPRQHWRNVHRFGSCKRFRATIKIYPEKKP
jgi:hypothetical protein